MRRFWSSIAIVGCLLALGAGYLAWPRMPSRQLPPESTTLALRPMAAARLQKPLSGADIAFPPEDLEFLGGLREKFAPHIHGKHAQIKLIEQLIAYLSARYPNDWEERIYAFLARLFPELAETLHEKYQSLVRYNDWLRGNRSVLMQMNAGDRRQALWAARREAFGADADEIFAAELRSQQVRDTFAALESADGLTVEQKLTTFMDAVHQAYGEQAAVQIQNRQTELMNGFLGVGAVQADLQAMTPAERGAALRAIRSAMGMDEAALARWDQLDQQRDAAWDQGQAYRQERDRIQSQYEGEEERERVRELQERSFGAEAETLRNEEAAGFYRYDHERRYGRE